MRKLFPVILLTAIAVSGCAGSQDAANGGTTRSTAPQGSAVPLGQSVAAGDLTLTPVKVMEDSRCAAGTQCIWAGRLVLATRIEGDGWSEKVDLVAGERTTVHGRSVLLASALPERVAGEEIAASEYRFTLAAE